MALKEVISMQLNDRDLDFLIEAAASGVGDKANLKQILRQDEDFRNSFVSDEKVFNTLMADDEFRLGLYKRIADVCLFILGIFPDYAERHYRYPLSGEIRPQTGAGAKISPEEYEQKGQQFYKLAAEHQAAVEMDLSDTFWVLHENFQKAKKPLNFIADYYLLTKRHHMFA